MGLPSVITTDQRTEFHNQVNDKLMKTFDIKQQPPTIHRQMVLMKDAIRLLQMQLQSLHSSVGKVGMRKCLKLSMHITPKIIAQCKYTPFEAMFGCMAKFPVDINLALDYDPDEKLLQNMNSEDPPDKENERRKLMEKNIRLNIQEAQQKQKKYFDQKHGAEACFKVGATVLKRDFTRKKHLGGKLDYCWEGPFVITAVLGRGLYKLKGKDGSKVVDRVNGTHLKPFLSPCKQPVMEVFCQTVSIHA